MENIDKQVRDAPPNPDAIVYTMGKVGSSTISTSLQEAGLFCYDVHFLQTDRLTKMLQQYLNDPDVKQVPKNIVSSIHTRNFIDSGASIRMISLIRNPIMRNISAVFQNVPKRMKKDPDAIMDRLRNYPTRIPDSWFKNDFRTITGIDIFKADVDSSADHFQFSKGRFDVLIIKLETDDNRKSQLVSEFLGKEIHLTRANEASKKWYRDIYRQVVESPNAIRAEYIEECANLKYFKKFYSEEERAQFLSKAGPS